MIFAGKNFKILLRITNLNLRKTVMKKIIFYCIKNHYKNLFRHWWCEHYENELLVKRWLFRLKWCNLKKHIASIRRPIHCSDLRVVRGRWFGWRAYVHVIWLGIEAWTAGLTLGGRHLPNYQVALGSPLRQRAVPTRPVLSDHNTVLHFWIRWNRNN